MRRLAVPFIAAALVIIGLAQPSTAASFSPSPYLLKDINPGKFDSETVASGTNPPVTRRGVTLGSKFIFGADAGSGATVWVSDGTTAGTHQVTSDVENPFDFTLFAGKVYFQGEGEQGTELWVTDGTAAGTQQVYNINPALSGNDSSNPNQLTVVGNYLYFAAEPAGSGQELWRYKAPPTVGPPAPPQLITSFGGSIGIQNMKAFGSKVLFSSNGGGDGFEPWISDGTSGAGHTFELKNIASTNASSNPDHFTTVGSTAFFTADDTSGVELWKTDGTSVGTVLAADVWPGASSSVPTDLFAYGTKLLFSASNTTTGNYGAFVYSGGAVHQLGANLHTCVPNNPGAAWTSYAGYVYFCGNDYASGKATELYRTKGVPGDVRLVKDINPGNNNSSPQEFRVVGNQLFFQATDATHGTELWKTNGTAAGTTLVKDIYPGTTSGTVNSSYPQVLGVLGGTLFVQAHDQAHGAEPWVFTTRATTTTGYPKASYKKKAAKLKHLHLLIKVKASGYVPTGTVTLKHGTTVIGTGTLKNGAVSIHITVKLPKGKTKVRAYYAGNINASSSYSKLITIKVK